MSTFEKQPTIRIDQRTPPEISGAWPVLGHLLDFNRDRRALLERGFAEHGPVFTLKLGPQPVAVLIGTDAQRLFFSETDRALNISKPYGFLEAAVGRVLFIAPHETYLEQRPLVQQAFRRQKMLHYVDVMQREVQRWLDFLGSEGKVELTGAINRLVQEVAGRALLGEAFQAQAGREFWRLYDDISQALDPVLPPHLPLPKFIRRDRARARMRDILLPILDERRRHPEQHDDFLQDFVNYRDEAGKPVDNETLLSLLLGLMFAGHETTAGQAAWTIILLLQHPEYLARVQAEIDAHLPPGAPFTPENMRRLEHIAWAVREVERLRPSADVLLRTVDEPLAVRDYTVPAGWQVMTAAEIAHQLPNLWTNPSQFDPLRFAPGREEDRQDRFSLIGFGGGAHKSTGINFANNEMMVITALLFQQFEVTLLSSNPGIQRGLGANRPEETWIHYRRR